MALARGITGAYAAISCGASCAPATVQWKESGVLYTIQWRAGTKATMVALADSAIDAGRMPGPKMLVTGPYLEGAGAFTPQMHELKDAEDARRQACRCDAATGACTWTGRSSASA